MAAKQNLIKFAPVNALCVQAVTVYFSFVLGKIQAKSNKVKGGVNVFNALFIQSVADQMLEKLADMKMVKRPWR